jgi:UDP-glucose 4-epimerase
MRIFITGVNSFVGKELISSLKKNSKHKIYGCDLNLNKNKFFDKADIRKKDFFKKIPKNINTIIHLAAISRDKDCSNDLSECYMTNVVGTLNVIEAAKKLNIKNIIFASTEWVYPNEMASKKVSENSLLNTKKLTSDYAVSKLISENHLIDHYKKNKNLNITILRFGIIYGERKNNWSAVEAIFNSVKNSDVITIGSRKTARKFIHIRDIVTGIIKSLKLKKLNIINLQGPKLITLENLIETSCKILQKKVKILEKDKKNPNVRNVLDGESIKKLKFKSRISLRDGLISLDKYLNF